MAPSALLMCVTQQSTCCCRYTKCIPKQIIIEYTMPLKFFYVFIVD